MKIETIQWQDALLIRHQVLWPSKPPSFCQVQGDETANHYGAFIKGELVCVASVYIDGRSARLRKFATLPECQGKGIGSQVIAHIMETLRDECVERFWCDARTSAVSFYQRFGLEQQGEEFLKSGVPYFKMEISV
ncbi:GNAT family N-acetyltransferase [Leucothrix arctica]|uniref:GNAT family N-acetyltransferase n=1 Tax=Leucothrix arctica TaxID=1481894 RepID=A0A317CH71_9GAMM|nr:GNAT family N-acetyltransferase [Leucothrix arctica]PWQ97895.1 GNAT family N-acetyltransferase [Leucothrix arctica]